MGREIIKVPSGFEHPKDAKGDFVPGAHLEPLYIASEESKSCFQIYENVTEGTPVSPIFESLEKLAEWLEVQGNAPTVIHEFIESGHCPSLVISHQWIKMLK